MTLGTGIFLGLVFVGVVALYGITKDRWNWGKGAKRLGIGTVAVIALGVLTFLAWEPVSEALDRPEPYMELGGVKLGASKEDVKFASGVPFATCKSPSDPAWEQYVYVLDWTTDQKMATVFSVMFKDGIGAWRIDVHSNGASWLQAPELDGLYTWQSLENVQKRFGAPSHVDPSPDGLSRTFFFRAYNLYVTYKQGSMNAYGIYHPKRPDDVPGGDDIKCTVTEQ